MIRNLESRIFRLECLTAGLERSTNNRSSRNEILGFSKEEKEAKVAAKALKIFSDEFDTLDRASDSHNQQVKRDVVETFWRFDIEDTRLHSINDNTRKNLIKPLEALLKKVSKECNSSEEPDFSGFVYSDGQRYHAGSIYLVVRIPNLRDPDNASNTVSVFAYYKYDNKSGTEDIYDLDLYFRDMDQFKKYCDKFKVQ